MTVGAAYGAESEAIYPVRVESVPYPILALQSRTQGEVVINCRISRDGSVLTAEIISGPHIFSQAVLDNARRWKFRSVQGQGGSVSLVYSFTIEGTTVGIPRSSFVYEHPNRVTVISEAPYLTPATQVPHNGPLGP